MFGTHFVVRMISKSWFCCLHLRIAGVAVLYPTPRSLRALSKVGHIHRTPAGLGMRTRVRNLHTEVSWSIHSREVGKIRDHLGNHPKGCGLLNKSAAATVAGKRDTYKRHSRRRCTGKHMNTCSTLSAMREIQTKHREIPSHPSQKTSQGW